MVKVEPGTSLNGKFFLTYDDANVLDWQGVVVGRLDTFNFLVRLGEWVTGKPTFYKVVPITAMSSWEFFDTSEQMIERSERGNS